MLKAHWSKFKVVTANLSGAWIFHNLSRLMTKPTKWVCTQQRLRSAWASAQSDQSSPCTQWVARDPSFLHADSEDADQTGRTPRLIWVFAGHTCHFVGFVMRQLILRFLGFRIKKKGYKWLSWLLVGLHHCKQYSKKFPKERFVPTWRDSEYFA